jgi:G patch domain-containing protein 1
MKPFSKKLQADTVVDEQGRRRFHGAFTGGYSAGYFNSVGSEEVHTLYPGRNCEPVSVLF